MSKIEKSQGERNNRRLRGDISEDRVVAALSGLPGVRRIDRSVPNDKRDRRGVDITVQLEPQEPTGFRRVSVQVKSSDGSIEAFRKSLMRRARAAGSHEILDEWLDRERLIILNGQLPPERIVDGFNKQLQRMRNRRDVNK